HPLVSAAARLQLARDQQKLLAELALYLVNEAFQFDPNDLSTWQECERLLPHAVAVTAHAEGLYADADACVNLLNRAGLCLLKGATFVGAKGLLARARPLAEGAFGHENPGVAVVLHHLGLILGELGEIKEAQTAFERALSIDSAAYGADHPQVASDLH